MGAKRNILSGDKKPKSERTVPTATLLCEGWELLAAVEEFFSRHLILPDDNAMVALVLWAAHTHAVEAFESTPRLLVTSPEPGSGKTRVIELLGTTCPRALEAVNVTPSYLFRKVEDEAGRPTILFDEIDTVFGPKAKDNEEIRGFLNAGHRRGAKAGRCVTRGKTIETEEIEAYSAVAMAGLGYVPDTIASRSVQIRMRRRAPGETVEPFRRRLHEPRGNELRDDLAEWCEQVHDQLAGAFPAMPDEVKDRDADVWEPLLAIADAAGGDWPRRARVAAVALVAASKQKPPSLGVRLLADIQRVFGDLEQMTTDDLIGALRALEEAPWSDMKGKPLDPRGLSRILGDYDIKPTTIRVGSNTLRGYRRMMFHDAWQRYVAVPPEVNATSATTATPAALEGWNPDAF